MKLPNNEVGISDIIEHRECAQRFRFKMRRHTPMPEHFQIDPGERDEPPEATNWTNYYGSAVHDAIAIVERESVDDDVAIQRVWPDYAHWLDPEDLQRMTDDLATYHERTVMGYRLIANEKDMRVPLFVYKGGACDCGGKAGPEGAPGHTLECHSVPRQIYFRFKVDALYQSMADPGVYLTRDYKSSRWPKTEEEIHKDIQQWSYNFGLHEMYPEIENLTQLYDMLRFGVTPTHKNPMQRQQIKRWLIKQVTAILEDEKAKPTQNEWCYTCPIMLDCRVTHLSATYWKNRLAALAPEKKVGRKLLVQLPEDEIDRASFEVYTEVLTPMKQTMKTMERYIEAVEGVLRDMPSDRREELGFTLAKARQLDTFGSDALRQMHAAHGDDFYHLIQVTKKAVADFYGEDSDEYRQILALAEKKQTRPSVKALRR